MKKKLLHLALFAMLLPVSTMAQTYHFTTIDGLEYIYEESEPDKPFIWVGTSAFSTPVDGETVSADRYIYNATLRNGWRQLYNANQNMFYKSDLDNITTIEPRTPTTALNGTDYAGIKYFRNLESLTIRSSSSNVILNLSENKKLSSLTFTLATIKLR